MAINSFHSEALLKSASNYPISKGDFDGHPFRGNQYRDGGGAGGGKPPVKTSAAEKASLKAYFYKDHDAAATKWARIREQHLLRGERRAAEAAGKIQDMHREDAEPQPEDNEIPSYPVSSYAKRIAEYKTAAESEK